MKAPVSSVDQAEIARFTKDSAHWWDENGPFKPLHMLNPLRMGYIRDQAAAHFGLDDRSLSPLKGLRALDIGCGGGLVSESLARMGATVTGIDADQQAIEVAQAHADAQDLVIDYQVAAAETLGKARYDLVLALEIVEHVADPQSFVKTCAALCKPGGLLIMSTLNRTPQSYALGIIAAEHILRWVPQGTHDWKKFVKPSELARMMRDAGGDPFAMTGYNFNPLSGLFSLSDKDMAVNYIMAARKTK